MAKVGYARVSSIGQSLEVQLEKLKLAGCDRIYQEKKSGTTTSRPEFQKCMNYIREGDTLVVTRLDRLARSVLHLAELSSRLDAEGIHLVVIDQSIDTGTPTGRLMFNLLACIAEFENELRAERQREGIEKAKENNVKFGRPQKADDALRESIRRRRGEGASIGVLVKEFKLSQATIYRSLASSEATNAETDTQ